MVVVPSSRRLAVRRLRRRLGVWGAAVVDPIAIPSGGLGWFLHFSGSFCSFLFLLDFSVKCVSYLIYGSDPFPQKKKKFWLVVEASM